MFGRLLFVTFGTLNPLPLEPSSKPGWQRSAPYVLPGSVPTASFNAQKHQGLDMEVCISFQEPQEFGRGEAAVQQGLGYFGGGLC